MIAEVKDFSPKPPRIIWQRRACGECDTGMFGWATADIDLRQHQLVCLNCGTAYNLNGECPDDFEAD